MGRTRIAGSLAMAALTAGILATAVAEARADEAHEPGAGYVDENGDGIPDGRASHGMRGHGRSATDWHGTFVDEDGDGVNDLMQDADGDGILNGMDGDYLKEKGIVMGRGWIGHAFVDEDGDGVNDLTQDADADGIPNGIDADYQLPEGVTLSERGRTMGMGGSHGFLDEDGDGVNDLMQDTDGDGILNGMDPDYALPEGMTRGHQGGGHRMGGSAGFIDTDGDGVNDLMQDADGDGILNGMDADYQMPQGAVNTGRGMGRGHHGRMWGAAQLPGEGAAVSPPAGTSELAQQAGDASSGGAAPPTGQSPTQPQGGMTQQQPGMPGSAGAGTGMAQGQSGMPGTAATGTGMHQGTQTTGGAAQGSQGMTTSRRGRMMGGMRGRPAQPSQTQQTEEKKDTKGN